MDILLYKIVFHGKNKINSPISKAHDMILRTKDQTLGDISRFCGRD